MNTRIQEAFLLLMFASFVAPLQAQPHKLREEIKQMKREFIQENLQLTEKEQSDFMPLYDEFEKKREELHKERRSIMQNYKKNNLNMSDKELLLLADSLVQIESRSAGLAEEYHNKFKTVLPPVKLVLLYRSERQFKKHLIHKMRHRHRKGKN